jgi:hypothetical protein
MFATIPKEIVPTAGFSTFVKSFDGNDGWG